MIVVFQIICFPSEYRGLCGTDVIHRGGMIVLRREKSRKGSWRRRFPRYFLEFYALSKKVYFHDYYGLRAWKRRFSMEEMPSPKKHKSNVS